MKENYVFFLGGYDLEMMTISEILQEKRCEIYDHKLTWGAKASHYKNEIENLKHGQIPVLVELEIDIVPPANAIVIDHHNENAGADKRTSIEQIADLLQMKLTEEQKYVAVNDKEYIPGLKKLGLSEDKIKEIRKKDRKTQGVTDKDEKDAEIVIKKFSEVIRETIIIEYAPERTSPIADLLYGKYQKIFVITRTKELNFYGDGETINLLEKRYQTIKEKDNGVKTWYGGSLPCYGYFGASKAITKQEIKELISQPIFSHHIFLFPFVLSPKNPETNFEDMKKSIDNINGWKLHPFDIDNKPIGKEIIDDRDVFKEDEVYKHNELRYFYEHVNESLFNIKSGRNNSIEDQKNMSANGNISYYFKKLIENDSEVTFQIRNKCRTENFHLSIENISLRIFRTNVGVLTISFTNKNYPDLESVLKINDFGRRIYPQFLGKHGTDETKNVFLPNKIDCMGITEEFKTENYFKKACNYADYIKELLKPISEFKQIIDDRMYTLCWYGNSELMNTLKSPNADSTLRYNYENSRDWYRYTFVDGENANIGNEQMKRELIQNSAYARFVEDGTIYGMTRYSFMCLTDRKWHGYNIIRLHMQKMYCQMALLLLVQRASILNYNSQILGISENIEQAIKNTQNNKFTEIDDHVINETSNVQGEIISFINTLWFDEVSPQEQGIELYDLARKQMKLPEELTTLKDKAGDLHNYVDLIISRRNDKAVLSLSKLAIYFIPFTLLIGFWSMGVSFLFPLVNNLEIIERGDSQTKFNFVLIMTFSFITTLFIAIGVVVLLRVRHKYGFFEKSTKIISAIYFFVCIPLFLMSLFVLYKFLIH